MQAPEPHRNPMRAFPLLLLAAAVAHVLAVPPNVTLFHEPTQPPSVNISFVKEVTLTIQPQDFELSPQDEQRVSGLVDSGLRFFDPIMRFLDSLVSGWSHQPPPETVHA